MRPPVKLGTAVSLVMGQAPAAADCNKDGRGTPFVKVGEFGAERPVIREWTTDPKKLAKETDVLICVVGATCGKINLGTNCAIGRSVAAIRPKPDRLDQRYLWYFMQGRVLEMRALSQGAAQTVITREMINDIDIPLPPLEEQRQIVAMLDEAFGAIDIATANAEKNLANARALFDVKLSRIMDGAAHGWQGCAVGSLGTTLTGSTPKTSDNGNFGNHIPFIKPGDFNPDGTLNYENEGLSQAGALGARRIASGSALMVCIGATIGKSAYAERDITVNQQINALIPSKEVSGKFVYYQFLTAPFQEAVRRQSGQATLPIISKSKWNELRVWLPPLDQQLYSVDLLDKLMAERVSLETLAKAKFEKLHELKQSLLRLAFSAELPTKEMSRAA